MMLKKINAGALQLTMFAVIVIALLLAAFIILIDTHKRFSIQTDFVLEVIQNANRGVDYALQNDVLSHDTTRVNLKNNNINTIKVYRDYWGLFEKVVSISEIKTKRFKKIALLGAIQPIDDRTVLYLEEQNRPLVLVGNSKIQGVAYLPKQGVTIGNISGHTYYGSQLIYGKTETSRAFPTLLEETLDQLKLITKKTENLGSNQFLDLKTAETYQNSFLDPIKVVYSQTEIDLTDISLTGHILVQSETKITVGTSSNLKDVILVAPVIEINDHVKGNFQAFASLEINIGKHCMLDYPSAIVVNDLRTAMEHPIIQNEEDVQIHIGSGSILKGVMVFLGNKRQENFRAQVLVEEDSIVVGEVYCNLNMELRGRVDGSVFTSNFVARQAGSIFQNHIYNGNILIDSLPPDYVGLVFENSKKGVLKWLY